MNNNNTEQWRDIEGYEGLYKVSDIGNVYSNYIGDVKAKRIHNGYEIVDLNKEGNVKTMSVHRLVAESFIPNPEDKPTVNHINEVKHDNRIDNLMWATHKENSNWGTLKDRQKAIVRERMSDEEYREAMVWHRSKITIEQVKRIKELLCGNDTAESIAKSVDVSINSVRHIQRLNAFSNVLPELNKNICSRNERIKNDRVNKVLELHHKGLTNKEIASILNVNPVTPYRICKKHLKEKVR